MAEILETFPTEARGMALYPWEEWLDGRVWKLTHGIDFQCGQSSIRAAIYQAAGRAGIKVKTSACAGDNTVILQAVPR